MSDMTPGKICWNELTTPDVEAAKKFYGELFGWETSAMDMGGGVTDTMFRTAGAEETDAAGGMFQITPQMKGRPPHWLSYVLVEDIKASVAKARSLGAIIVKDVTDLPMGKLAIFAIPRVRALLCGRPRPAASVGLARRIPGSTSRRLRVGDGIVV
jgi:predicted enzyme related to lactoylglutathione lyase